jgi:hypothetical protein
MKKYFKKISLSLPALLSAVMFIAGCAGNGSGSGSDDDGTGYVLAKTTDWEKLNLKDSVEEYIEQDLTRSAHKIREYTKFNEQGYIVEQGTLDYDGLTYKKDYKQVKEVREYDAENNLRKKRFGDNLADSRKEYKEEIYDSLGRALECWDKNRPSYYNEKEEKTLAYRYEDAGSRTEKVFTNDKLSYMVKYDKYRNEVSRTTYDDSGSESRLYEKKYEYDKKGNILNKIEYDGVKLPAEKDKMTHRTAYEYNYTYDENKRMTSLQRFKHEAYPDLEKKKLIMQRDLLGASQFTYDENGNNTENGRFIFECDRHNNWFFKYDHNSSTNTHERQIKYFGEEIQSGDYYD